MRFVELNDMVMLNGFEFLRIISRCYNFGEYLNIVFFVEYSLR